MIERVVSIFTGFRFGVLGEYFGVPNWLWISCQLIWTSIAIFITFKLSAKEGSNPLITTAVWAILSCLYHTIAFSGMFYIVIAGAQTIGLLVLIGTLVHLCGNDEAGRPHPPSQPHLALIINAVIVSIACYFGQYSGIWN